MSALAALDATFPHLAEIAERLRRVTVEVYGPRGGGAGILWAPDLIVTNAHVVHSPSFRVRLADDSHVEARLVTADPCVDLVERVAEDSPASVAEKYARARNAQPKWAGTPLAARLDTLVLRHPSLEAALIDQLSRKLALSEQAVTTRSHATKNANRRYAA